MKPEYEQLKARMSPTAQAIAWAAGVYEGEGSCGCSGQYIFCNVTQKDRWLLDVLLKMFGGHVYGPYGRNKWTYQWRVSNNRAAGFLLTIYKFMSPRRQEQINNALTKWRASTR